MKRVYAAFLFLSVAVMLHAEPYGILEHAVDNPTYGIDLFLAGQPIRYAVAADITPKEKQIFINNLRAWPKKTLAQIPPGRRDELKDVIALLKQPVQLEETSPKQADVFLRIGPEEEFKREDKENSYACGTHHALTHEIAINPICRYRFDEVTLHEIGHFYGLADQYPEAHNANQQYYGSVNTNEYSMMYSMTNDSVHQAFTCDDADGFISLIDLRLFQQNGYFSTRATYGWKSLCTDNIEYREATKYKGSYAQGETLHIYYDALPLFATQYPQATYRDKNTHIVSDMHDKGPVGPCPADATGWRVFTYDKAYEQLNIYCVKGQRRPKPGDAPDFQFPLPTADNWEVVLSGPYSVRLKFFNKKLAYVSLTLIHTNVARHQHISITLENALFGKKPSTQVDIFQNGEHFYTKVASNDSVGMLQAHPEFGPILFKLKQELDKQTRLAVSFDKNFYQPLIQTPSRKAYEKDLALRLPTAFQTTPKVPFSR